MNEENYWKQFFCTGKVEDYLKYKQYLENDAKKTKENEEVKETGSYAGFYYSDGDRY